MDSIVREKLAALILGTLAIAGHEGMTEEEALREDNRTQHDQIEEQQDQMNQQQLEIEELRRKTERQQRIIDELEIILSNC